MAGLGADGAPRPEGDGEAAAHAGRGLSRVAGFKVNDVVPKTDRIDALSQSLEKRAEQRLVLQTLTKAVKKEKRKNAQLKKKALSLSSHDLCDIIGMKQHLAAQWEAKNASTENSSSAAGETASEEK